MNRKLYFYAILPLEPHLSEMQKITEDISEKYQTRKALNSPPHITLIPPFWYYKEYQDDLKDIQASINQRSVTIPIEIDGFSTFPRKVLFIAVKKNPMLDELVQQLYEMLPDKVKSSIRMHPVFHPHITIAFKDISWSNFNKAIKEYLELKYQGNFTINTVSLLHHVNGKWQTLK